MAKQNSQKYSDEMVALMVEALGGDAQVDKIIKQKRLAAVLKPGVSVGEVYDQAKEEGWLDWLCVLTFGEISSMLGGKRSSSTKRGARITKEEVAEMRGKIATFLKDHPGSKVAEIAAVTDAEASKVAVQLRKMISEGVVKSHGAKAKTTYSLK